MAVEQTWALQNATVNAITARQAFSSIFAAAGGIITDLGTNGNLELAVAQNGTPNMTVLVAAGRAWIPGTALANLTNFDWNTQGQYFALNDANVSVTIATADPVNPRIDSVYIATQDSFYSGGSNQTVIGVVTGTPAASPSAPSIPSNGQLLAHVAVAASASSIVNANITDSRTIALPRLGSVATTYTGAPSGASFTTGTTGITAGATPATVPYPTLIIAWGAGLATPATGTDVCDILLRLNGTPVAGGRVTGTGSEGGMYMATVAANTAPGTYAMVITKVSGTSTTTVTNNVIYTYLNVIQVRLA